ncbi:hypothetical protein IW146_005064 [Coemansia sp. RSA 922]|nr:hypothetical protein IW146_005064 [Coemansia sp. RSA 922]KAJ2350841.1 hypothetical protein GGH92_002157 [Coemansia sp. RSA 2673]
MSSYFFTLVTRDNFVQLSAAVFGLLTTYLWSAISYVVRGPRHAAWDFRTHYVRDIVLYLMTHQNDAGVQLFIKLSSSDGPWPALNAGLQRVPQGFASRLAIPAYPLGPLPPSCVWAAELQEVARISEGREMHAECIIAGDVPLDSTDERRGPKVILHFHGGAYVTGTVEQYRPVHLLLSRYSGLRVYGFAYRLAPHSLYPTQLYDAYCAFSHLLALGYKEHEIVFTGDSAGGNLALALWQFLQKPQLFAMILVSPRVDIASSRRSWSVNAGVDIIHGYNIHDADGPLRKLLVPQGRPVEQRVVDLLEDPYLSPINADLSGLPPMLVQVATAEVMFDDIAEFVRRAQAQNRTNIQYEVFDGGFHDFQFVPLLIPNSVEARENIGKFIHALANGS